MENEYPILEKSINILKILAYILVGLGVIGALIIFFGKTPGSGKLASLGILIVSGFYAFIFYLFSEIIHLLMDINDRIKKTENLAPNPKRDIR